MKLVGDVSEEHKKLALELEEMEKYFDTAMGKSLPTSLVAKGYVCLAHDWYKLGADEKGVELLEKAESSYPGYFRNLALTHGQEDPEFDRLLKSLSVELAWILINRVNDMSVV